MDEKKINIEKEIAQANLAQIMSTSYKEQKQLIEPFLKRLLKDREHHSEPEQKLYEFILKNWLWCVPIRSAGYRMLNKEYIMKHAFDFNK
jgi:hypothetical protein